MTPHLPPRRGLIMPKGTEIALEPRLKMAFRPSSWIDRILRQRAEAQWARLSEGAMRLRPGRLRNLRDEAPQWASLLPAIPRKLNEALSSDTRDVLIQGYITLLREQKRQNALLAVLVLLLGGGLALLWWR